MIADVDVLRSAITPSVTAEGVVYVRADARPMAELENRAAFKVINNRWLMKQ